MARYADLHPAFLRRACTFARLPSVTRRVAAERYGISVGMLRRALKEYGRECSPSRYDLVLHCLTDAGTRHNGQLGDLRILASYLDYVNKDGSTESTVRTLIGELVRDRRLVVEGDRWALVGEFLL